MTMPMDGERKLTRVDFGRLRRLLAASPAPALEDLLAEAEVVDSREMPADVDAPSAAPVHSGKRWRDIERCSWSSRVRTLDCAA
jgi:hypothetical protein